MAGAAPRSNTVDFLSAWPRVERAVRTRAAKTGLSPEEADELLHRVQVALLRKAEFRSARGAERYGLAVTRHVVGSLLARRAGAARVEFVPLDAAEEIAAPEWESPETRAVIRAGFDAVFFGADPALSAVEREALLYPLRRSPYAARTDQMRWALRLHRVRRKLDAAVADLLAPVVVPAWKVRGWLRARSTVMTSALAGAVLAAGPVLIANGESQPDGSGLSLTSRGESQAELAVTTAQSPSGEVLLSDGRGPREIQPGPHTSPTVPRAERPPIVVRAGLEDEGRTATAQLEMTFVVADARGRNGGNEFRATVGCDSPTRALVCEAARTYVVPVATDRGR